MTGRTMALVATFVVAAWSIVELVSLGLRHSTGPQVSGIAVASIAVVAGILSFVLLASDRKRTWATWAVLVLWAIVAIGGLAGVLAHVFVPMPGSASVDLRFRPVGAPLIFTALGLVGGAALFYGQRARDAFVRQR